MKRGALLLALAALTIGAPALAGDIHQKKTQVDAKIATLQERIAAAQQREAQLRTQISAVTSQIRSLERQVGDVSAKLDVLQRDLALHQARLDKLNALYDLETRRYEFEKRQYALALGRLNARLLNIYISDDPSPLDIVLHLADNHLPPALQEHHHRDRGKGITRCRQTQRTKARASSSRRRSPRRGTTPASSCRPS